MKESIAILKKKCTEVQTMLIATSNNGDEQDQSIKAEAFGPILQRRNLVMKSDYLSSGSLTRSEILRDEQTLTSSEFVTLWITTQRTLFLFDL